MSVLKLDEVKKLIFSDEEYNNWCLKIAKIENEFALSSDFNNMIALDHGMRHMERVADNVYLLMRQYGIDEADAELGYIAGIIHDIGMINGKKSHAKNGSLMVGDFLRKFNILNEEQIKKIINAVEVHGNGEGSTNKIGLFLAIADKVDLCKERSLGDKSTIKDILKYNCLIKNKTLEIRYYMKNDRAIDALYMIPKSIDVPVEISKKLGLKIKYYINDLETDFSDRDSFSGEIYNSK